MSYTLAYPLYSLIPKYPKMREGIIWTFSVETRKGEAFGIFLILKTQHKHFPCKINN